MAADQWCGSPMRLPLTAWYQYIRIEPSDAIERLAVSPRRVIVVFQHRQRAAEPDAGAHDVIDASTPAVARAPP
jgi:hypothetical protein